MNNGKEENLRELFSEAKAIYSAMRYGAITYQEAKLKTTPLLNKLNAAAEIIAKKHNVKPKLIRFHDLGRG